MALEVLVVKYNDTDFIITECIMILKTMKKEVDDLSMKYKELLLMVKTNAI
jgi:hypothetical protein